MVSGDTLWRIAQQFNTTVNAIRTLNNLTSDVLQIGQQLLIPSMSNSSPTTYIVQPGDSLYKIANQFGITVNDLIQANNLTTNVLQIGQVLRIPT